LNSNINRDLANKLIGAIPALVTPFIPSVDSNSTVDFVSLRKLIEHVQSAGIKCVVACGSTGEAVSLSDQEFCAVVKNTREIFQGTVIAGCGASSTERSIALGILAKNSGAQALLVVNPPYNKPTPAGLVAHYTALAHATSLPLIAYNVPGRTGMNMPVDVVIELARSGMIIGIKEASGSIEQMTEIAARAPQGFVILSGEDSLVLPAMSLGATGVISVAANVVPRAVMAITAAVERGDFAAARTAQLAIFPLIQALFNESNPIPIKAILAQRGIIAQDTLRLPLLPASATTREKLSAAIISLA